MQPQEDGWAVETSWLAGGVPGAKRLPGPRGGWRVIVQPNAIEVTKLFAAIARAFLSANYEEG